MTNLKPQTWNPLCPDGKNYKNRVKRQKNSHLNWALFLQLQYYKGPSTQHDPFSIKHLTSILPPYLAGAQSVNYSQLTGELEPNQVKLWPIAYQALTTAIIPTALATGSEINIEYNSNLQN